MNKCLEIKRYIKKEGVHFQIFFQLKKKIGSIRPNGGQYLRCAPIDLSLNGNIVNL